MMLWLSDSPSPVPFPGAFVVKNGVKTRSLTPAGIPIPLSLTLTSSRSPTARVEMEISGTYPSPSRALRACTACSAFSSRLMTTRPISSATHSAFPSPAS